MSKKSASSTWIFYLMPLIMIWHYPIFLLLFIGSLPSLVTLIVDQEEEGYKALCVAAGNMCGILSMIWELIDQGGSFEVFLTMLSNPFVWLILYGPAVFGLFVYFAFAKAFIGSVRLKAHHLIKQCEEVRASLIAEWGEEIEKVPPLPLKKEDS